VNILELKEVETFYGKSHVLFEVSMAIEQGQIVGLVGRNGAGKSTTLKTIIGITPPKAGSVLFKGYEIVGMPAFRIARKGIGYVPEDRRVFSDLSVLEHLEIMTAVKPRKGQKTSWEVDNIFRLFPHLERLKGSRGMELSGGEQQMLTIARSLMADPEVLLLDEPTEGLAPLIVREIHTLIQKISEEVTILLAEQNLAFVLKLVDLGYVIDQGRIVFKGTSNELRENRLVKEQHLAV
jgi:branched-chain amino acid transport system ATP-binding protein